MNRDDAGGAGFDDQAGAPPLLLEGLAKSFGAVTVLASVDLTLSAGEILGVLGPNGAGKSTLFNLITGVVPLSAGSIRYFGRDITADPIWTRARAGIGRTFQIPKPFPRTTVYENVLIAATHGRGVGIRPGKEVAQSVLERTGLYAKRAAFARDLSLLDLKRLELAKALSVGPRILLLDEIAGGLTDAECDSLLDIVHQAHAEGIAILWIEHVLHVLKRAATRLAVLSGGRILATGDPAAIIADPRVRKEYGGA
jgi:branched-chain amino acid transport system ATP-binding protein